ncbi:hypothetical protein OU789_10820 [Halocynthiibacter sp. C4]|uniref:hypothetical protein n=1 Tax=Halocynthiibacter sp. C4 TaxID=2992758 RepID=UPI00237BF720|nr:hypothetical protein [Halocynthiibacter sp. C4]MDE0590419.1 hypothetical protein [Halocynthiibacter sp. C4]
MWPAIAMAAGSVLSGVMGSNAASSAARAQQDAADKQLALQEQMYGEQKYMFSPYLKSGNNALAALNYELGLGERPTFGATPLEVERYQINSGTGGASGPKTRSPEERKAALPNALLGMLSLGIGDDRPAGFYAPKNNARKAKPKPQYGWRVGGKEFASKEAAQAYAEKNARGGTAYQGYQKTPGYDFRLNEGLDSVEAGVGARHGLNSGATMKALDKYGQDYATGEYNNYLNGLRQLAGQGQSSAAMTANAGTNYANSSSNALANYGDAAAAGSIGSANAWTGAMQNGLGAWMYGKGEGIF